MTRSVAIIAVHGVADQEPGATAREIAGMLATAGPGLQSGDHYSAFYETPMVIAVPKKGGLSGSVAKASPPTGWRGFLGDTPNWLHSPFFRAERAKRAAEGENAVPAAPAPTYDIAYSAHFLDTVDVPEKEQRYQTVRLTGTRTDHAGIDTHKIDIYEMYWADLSRLGKNVLRIVGEFYQLLFHLSVLGRDIVNHARLQAGKGGDQRLWQALGVCHGLSTWMLTRPIALINLLLLLTAFAAWAVLLPGDAAGVASWIIAIATCIVVAVAVWFKWPERFGFLILALLVIVLFVPVPPSSEPEGYVWSIALVIAIAIYFIAVAMFNARVEGVALFGLAISVVLVASLFVAFNYLGELPLKDRVFTATARMAELGLIALLIAWSLLGVFNVGAFVVGQLIVRMNPPDSGSRETRKHARELTRAIFTGRLAAALSVCLFAIATIAVWAVVNAVAQKLLGPTGANNYNFRYTSVFFVMPSECDSLACFVHAKLSDSAELFSTISYIVAFLALVTAYAVGPSLLSEVMPPKTIGINPAVIQERTDRQGGWLSVHLGTLGKWVGFSFLILAGLNLYYLVMSLGCHIDVFKVFFNGAFSEQNCRVLHAEGERSVDLIASLVAGSAVTLVSVSSRLGDFAKSARGVLDLILDVDNYFKERPETKTPRGRIYARYRSLLREIVCRADADYSTVVIVAHSQGTTITADLLRLIHTESTPLAQMMRTKKIFLLTAGCPLRQLYTPRFPQLYSWMDESLVSGLANKDEVRGPNPARLGIERWTNVFQSGDYVGRNIWHIAARDNPFELKPFAVACGGISIIERCVGSGAHTHYFDGTVDAVAEELDKMIVAA